MPAPGSKDNNSVKSFIKQLALSPFFKVVGLDLNHHTITACVFDMLGEGEIPFYKFRNSYAGVSDLMDLIVKCEAEAVAVEPIGRLQEEFYSRTTNEGLPVIVVDLFAARLAVRLPQ